MAKLRKSAQISGWVAQCSDGDTGQKSCAVFPHAHALFFVPSAGSGSSEYLLRPSPLDVFRRIEAGKVMTDNLIGCVTFDSFGPGIPTENPALGVHHKNGIVLDSIEEHLISFLAFSERLGQ